MQLVTLSKFLTSLTPSGTESVWMSEENYFHFRERKTASEVDKFMTVTRRKLIQQAIIEETTSLISFVEKCQNSRVENYLTQWGKLK